MNKDIEIAVVGGSLIGPLTEALLRSIGFERVTTYEAAPQSRPQAGGVIGVRESGFEALAQAGIPLAEISAYPGKEVITYNIDNRQVTGLRDRVSYPGETTAWDIFHQAVDQRVQVQYGKRVKGISPDGGIYLADGYADADLVIFADGRNSTGRRLLDPDRALSYQGYLVWRGITDPVDGVVGFTRYRNDEHGRLFSITEPITQGVHRGQTDWTYYHNLTAAEFTAMVGKSPTDRVFLLPHHFTPDLRDYVQDQAQAHLPGFARDTIAGTRDLMAVPINDLTMPTRAAWRWGKLHAMLLGDALMTVRPHSGRGVNNGIDQAWELIHCLQTCDTLDQALALWQVRVLPQIGEWVQLGQGRALRNGLGVPADA